MNDLPYIPVVIVAGFIVFVAGLVSYLMSRKRINNIRDMYDKKDWF